MPPLKYTEVLSFSSEDPNHPVDNLLSAETFRKWRCSQESCGKQATVTLKLERLSSIHSIDIGNNGAAFVEVLVAREGVDFQVLLVASSFMTPGESRNSSDMNRVRMFGPDKLNKNVAEQKWDRVKVICTQPFNKTMQFGLSFITVTAASEGSATSTPKGIKLGSFTLKEEEEEDSISVGSVFARRKEKEMASPLTGAAAIRAASASAVSAVSSTSTPDAKKTKPINAPEMGFYQLKKAASPASERPKAPHPSTPSSDGREERGKERKREKDRDSDKHRDADKHRDRDKQSKDPESRNGKDRGKPKKDKNDHRNSTPETNKKKNDSKDFKRMSQENKQSSSSSSPSSGSSSKRKSAPFASLLKGVTFVLSGYQNPLRSQIRDMMVDMGARYKPDWDPSCTHLICAFANTPKYQQVKGKGKIVTAKWISDCHKNKIRYPWRRYALPKQDDARESEEEIWAEELLPKEEKLKPAAGPVDTDIEESAYEKESNEVYSDDEDTDDEIERVLAKQRNAKKGSDESKVQTPSTSTSSIEEPPSKKIKVDTGDKKSLNTTDSFNAGGINVKKELNGIEDTAYDDDTDIDEENMELVTKPDTSSLPLPTLGDYLKGKCFFIYGNMSSEMKQLLTRYIIAFDGMLEDYMTEKINFVITEDEWDDNFDNALSENPSLQFVKPSWIWRCSDKQKLVPFQPFMVVPKD